MVCGPGVRGSRGGKRRRMQVQAVVAHQLRHVVAHLPTHTHNSLDLVHKSSQTLSRSILSNMVRKMARQGERGRTRMIICERGRSGEGDGGMIELFITA
eukprot:COSAG04_NODE_1487_length_6557_cov_25.169402_4_plen_99_part_00